MMRGRHQSSSRARSGVRWIAGAMTIALAALTSLAVALVTGVGSASASTTVRSQLSLTGLASADNPLGGSKLGIHPGDSVSFSAAGAPTAGLQKLGLDSLADSVLGSLAKFQVTADFSALPGGAKDTKLSGSDSKTFSFPKKGTYTFTWTAQSVTPGVAGLTPPTATAINLNGNELKNAGVKLNAENEYVASVVVATNPPAGGIGVQLPSVGAHPSVTHVGSLPSVSVPGINTPTLHTSVPNLAPGSGSSGKGKSGSSGGGTANGSGPRDYSIVPVPEQVVPEGYGGGGFADGAGSGGGLSGVDNSSTLLSSGGGKGGASSATSDSARPASSGNRTIGLAAKPSPTGQLPVILAIVAIIALSLVAATYARLFLLRRSSGG